MDIFLEELKKQAKQLEEKIAETTRELKVVERMIYKRQVSNDASKDGLKLNKRSENKAILEEMITNVIASNKYGLRTSEIFKEVNRKGEVITYPTLRVYVTRMRDAGTIKKKGPNSYHWVLYKREPS